MCTKKCFRMPTLVIFGVILTIVLVFITGITLTNSINISNIVKLREKVASDSAAANSVNAAQTRAALVEQQYSTLQQHHLSRSDLNYITANHPKNLQRFLQTSQTQQQAQQPSPQPPLPHLPPPPAAPVQPVVGSPANTNNNNKIIIEIGIRNFTAAAAAAAVAAHQQQQLQLQQQTNNRSLSSLQSASSLQSSSVSASSSSSATSSFDSNQTTVARNVVRAAGAATIVEQLVAPFDGAIIDGNIESISVPATSEIRQQLNETLKYLAENDKTVTSHESKNSLMLNRLPPLNTGSSTSTTTTTLKPLNSSSNATTASSTPSPFSSSASSLSNLTLTATTKSFLNNSLNSSTSSKAADAAVAAVSKETILFSTLSTAAPLPAVSTTISPALTAAAPANQLSIEDHNPGMIDFEKRNYVKEMMQHAWQNYKLYAWGKNELRPLSQRAHSSSIFGSMDLGATIIDGLDTLYLMGLEKEYKEGRDWIERKFTLDNVSADLSVFETNIRFIGGLLTMYAFTGDNLYKERAQHVADKLLPAFQTPTGIPYGLVNPKTGLSKNYGWASGASSILSEFGTLHLEFSYLSDITGNPLYKERVQTIRQILKEIEKPKGLYPNFLNPKTGKWGQLHMSLGALGDSFYEYLLKAWLQSGQTDDEARQMFDEAMVAIIDKMVRTSPNGLTYVSDLKFDRLEHKMDHLACFSGGLFALGANTRQNEHTEKFMNIGKGITNTCHESYIRSTTRLGPEAFRFSEAAEARALKSNEKYYILRPETVESYFVLWRLTHDQKYRDWGWDAVQALEQHCRTPHGYSGIKNVYQEVPQKDDVQQSFFLAETLKYLYLLFSDDSLIPLDEWVFNTEAHPLPIRGANIYYRQATSTSAAATNAS
ncbi:mannosyl-oligosaccharide alpha-1,2-mannosidase IA isoform X1 [Calliphora vicina]|uniref:mannosyl-oligosaccharide alpha-1,2-mannosidase IA isoform X1 n=1 Tax=Calliphora vicina TaxID=7373 RepID=UPI00325B4A8B